MSKFLSTAAIKEFDALVKAQYQGQGFRLRNTMRERKDVVGNQVQFVKMLAGMAQQKAIQDSVSPMNINYSIATATLANWTAADYSDIFSQAEVNFDEKMELSKAIAMAIGRRMDQIAIDALNASSGSTVAVDFGSTSTNSNLPFAKLREANRILNANGVPADGERYLVMTASQESSLLNVEQFTSTRFVENMAVQVGGLNGQSVFGYKIIVLPTMPENGLPLNTNTRTIFAFHKQALGYAIGIDFRSEINYVPEKTSWLVNGLFKAGAVSIDDLGIVKILCDESVTT